ncbi:hypothetical protein [Streptomyces xanthochromogenes]|uniref:Uncharacterized protein n=1 Tax=Streptomyces xanthochromogenes TaxID=67384 RepID=A0ABQ3AX85_9ACTN|nr:hypothetical protein [Streptomyces xanthochromogenes]GGY70634.1 hypothetical protein GCM10010326_76060 [Streptomyces xanthochromogenes]
MTDPSTLQSDAGFWERLDARSKIAETLGDAFEAADHYVHIWYSDDGPFTLRFYVKDDRLVLISGTAAEPVSALKACLRRVLKRHGIVADVEGRSLGRVPELILVVPEPGAVLRIAELVIEGLPGLLAARYRLRSALLTHHVHWSFKAEGQALAPRDLSVRNAWALCTALRGPTRAAAPDLSSDEGAQEVLAELTRQFTAIGIPIQARQSGCCPARGHDGPHDLTWDPLSHEDAERLTAALLARPPAGRHLHVPASEAGEAV